MIYEPHIIEATVAAHPGEQPVHGDASAAIVKMPAPSM
jgi:hypothetical protein